MSNCLSVKLDLQPFQAKKIRPIMVFNGVYFQGVMGYFLWYKNNVCELVLVCFSVFGYIFGFGKVEKIAQIRSLLERVTE